jgi:hypothetical protein
VLYNRQNSTLLVGYSEDLIRRTTNFLKPVTTFLVSGQLPSLLAVLGKTPVSTSKCSKRYAQMLETVTSSTH